jgi:hypothetical protein
MTEKVFQVDKRRVFPHHRDMYGYAGDPHVVAQTVAEEEESGGSSVQDALQRHGALNRRADPGRLYHRSANSFNDPMSVYYVLDAIVESKRGTYLRPSYLVNHLQTAVPHIYWSNGVVGRIMAGWFHLCEEMYINDDINGEYIIVPDDEEDEQEAARRLLPWAQARDSQGRFYVLDPEGGDEGLLWLLMARAEFLKLATQAMQDDEEGENGKNWGKEMAPTDYFAAVMEERVRPAHTYRAQLSPATLARVSTPPKTGIAIDA